MLFIFLLSMDALPKSSKSVTGISGSFPKKVQIQIQYCLYIKVVFACKKLAMKMKHVLGFLLIVQKTGFIPFQGFFSNIKKIEFKTSVKVLFSAYIDLQRSSCNSFSKQNSN